MRQNIKYCINVVLLQKTKHFQRIGKKVKIPGTSEVTKQVPIKPIYSG